MNNDTNDGPFAARGRTRNARPARPARRAAWIALGVLVIAFFGVLAYALLPTRTRAIDAAMPAEGTPERTRLVEAGRYVATAGDCAACHTAPSGKPFAGGVPLASPIGAIYATNITPDADSGIGRYTLDDFDRALRHGIAADGRSLYPAMPYPSYARLSDADLRAMYAYFRFGVSPVRQDNQASGIAWPLSIRWPVAIWRKTFAPSLDAPPAYTAEHYGNASVARGAYLVQGAGHCGSCHTPRAATLQEKSTDESGATFLAGGPLVDGWVAVNLRSNDADGLGRWSAQDIVDTLRSARNPRQAVIGSPMSDVVTHSTQWLTNDDLQAVAAYLKTLGPAASAPARFRPDDATARDLAAGRENNRGAQLYVDNCAACHRTNGLGHAGAFPTLAGNPSVLGEDPSSLLRLILAGSELPATQAAPSPLGMPAFGWRLSDDEVAQLATFVRQGWGNDAPAATADQAKAARNNLARQKGRDDGGDKPAIRDKQKQTAAVGR